MTCCERCGKNQQGIHTCTPSAEYLAKIERVYAAAKNLIAQKGRHNTEIAYNRLVDAMKNNEGNTHDRPTRHAAEIPIMAHGRQKDGSYYDGKANGMRVAALAIEARIDAL